MVYLEYFIDLIFEIYAYFHKKLSFSSSLSEVLIGLVKNIKKVKNSRDEQSMTNKKKHSRKRDGKKEMLRRAPFLTN
jgi:hypothetical protein